MTSPQHISPDRATGMLAMHGAVLEMIAKHERLPRVLEALTLGVEELADGMLASILTFDPETRTLRHGAAPSLPDPYNAAIDGVVIGEAVGSCGTAAHRREQVVVFDVREDPLWVDFRDLADEHGLRACWSTPVLSGGGEVLGTFALYYRAPRLPGEFHRELIVSATHLARIALEHDRAERDLRDRERRFRTLATEVPVGIAEADADGQLVFVNDHWCDITDRPAGELVGDGWIDSVHPGDRDEVAAGWRDAIAGARPWQSEHRVITAAGAVRHVAARAAPLQDDDGAPCGFLSSCTDITARKEAEAHRVALEQQELIAAALQRGLLPDTLAGIEGMEVAARYFVGSAGMQAGGDWYDVFELPDGRAALAVGDVAGRGPAAAATMGKLRAALRAVARLAPEPRDVLAELNTLAVSEDLLATLVYATVVPRSGRVRFACAGHLPPLLTDAGHREAAFAGHPRNPPLGVIRDEIGEGELTIDPGCTLLLYTDGLVERRDSSLDDGLRRLREAAARGAGSLERLCDDITDVLGARGAGDDVAVLALRRGAAER